MESLLIALFLLYYTFTAASDGERILKIGQHLAKLWARKSTLSCFLTDGV